MAAALKSGSPAFRALKRLFDFSAAALALLLLWPLMLLIALLILIFLSSPVLFRQQRPGYRTRPFTLLKFRTMHDSRDPAGRLLPDSDRTPLLGRMLRKLSLDELPQLWNVLTGHMSFVGPRPLLMKYLPRYSPEQARRHEVRPGITGWAQVNGRNATTWPQRFACDLWYVDHCSLLLDARILLMTIGQVLRGQGVSPENEATMPEFMGNEGEQPASSSPPLSG